jgi:hypothetical protein
MSSADVLVGSSGEVYVAPVGTTMPVHYEEDLDAAFARLGFLDRTGVTWRDEKSFKSRKRRQSQRASDHIVTNFDTSFSFALMEWTVDALLTANSGGFSLPSLDHEYVFATTDAVRRIAVVIDVLDAPRYKRFTIPDAIVTSSIESNFSRNNAALLPVTLSVNQSAPNPWLLFSADIPLPPPPPPPPPTDPRLRARVIAGRGAPDADADDLAYDTTLYIDEASGDVFRASSAPPIPSTSNRKYAKGAGRPPAPEDGDPGDTWLDADTGTVYGGDEGEDEDA